MCHQRCVVEPDRWVFHRRSHVCFVGGEVAGQRYDEPWWQVAGCVVHSDRGSQFRSRKFIQAPRKFGLAGSMGRVDACGDNAAME